MTKTKVKATQEEVPIKSKKAVKAETKEVHVVKATLDTTTKKRKPTAVVETTEPVELLETKIKGKKNKKAAVTTGAEEVVESSTEVDTSVVEDTGVQADEVVDAAPESKKRQKVNKAEKQSKLLQQTLNVDKNGLSIMPVRVRRMLLDVVFNQRNRVAEKELTTHKDALLEASNLKEGYLSFHGFTQETLTYLRELINTHLDVERVKYERRRVKSLVEASPRDSNNKPVLSGQLQDLIDATRQLAKSNSGVSSTALYQQFDKKFYKEFTEAQRIYNLTGEEAYKFYRSLVSRDKIRLNLSGNLKLTAFIELVLKHFVAQANISCVVNGKSTLNLGNMVGATLGDNYLFSVVGNLSVWSAATKYSAEQATTKQKKSDTTTVDVPVSESTKTVPTFVDVDQLNPNNKFKYNSYVVDLCKNVSRSLLTTPPTNVNYTTALSQQELSSVYGSVKISSEFRSLCNQVLLELLHSIGNILKVIISTGKDRTITSGTVDALIHTYHLAFNLTDQLGATYSNVNAMTSAFNNAQTTLRAAKSAVASKTQSVE